MSAALAVSRLEGCQTPRVFTSPTPAGFEAADQALEFVESVGIHLDPWQRFAVRAALAEAADGRWAAFEVLLLVPRQNGKGEVLLALELAKLFLFRFKRPPLILHSAHLFPTAQEAFRRIRDVIDGSDVLRQEVRRISAGHGEEGIELRDGGRLRFMARTISGVGRGFSPTDLMLDEVFRLPIEAVSANLPALSAQFNPQIVYTSSAGFIDSEVLLGLLQRGRSGVDRSLAFMDWSAEPGADLDDRSAWAIANPALGIRITEQTIERERASLPDAEFERERLGKWADMAANQPISLADWQATAADRRRPRGVVPVFFLAVAPRMASASIGAAFEVDGVPHAELADHNKGTDWFVARVAVLKKKHPRAVFAVEASGAVGALLPELRDVGVEPEAFTAGDMGRGCAHLQKVTGDRSCTHSDDPLFTDALAGAVKSDVGEGLWKFSQRRSTVDISPLVAVTGAFWLLRKSQVKPKPMIVVSGGGG